MTANVSNTGGSSQIPESPPPQSSKDQIFDDVLSLLKKYKIAGGEDAGDGVQNTTSTQKTQTSTDSITTVEDTSVTSTTQKSSSTQYNYDSSNPQIPPPTSSSTTVPTDSTGTGNPWLQPSLLGMLFMTILESNFKFMQSKLQEGLQAASLMVAGGKAAIAEGASIMKKAMIEATQHLVSAIMAFSSAGVQAGSAAASAYAPKQAAKSVDNETANMEYNPNCRTDRDGTTLPGQRTTQETDVDTYLKNREYIDSGVGPGGQPLTAKEKEILLAQNEKIKPGTQQMKEWIDDQAGPSPRREMAEKEYDTQRAEIDKRRNDPEYRDKLISRKQEMYLQIARTVGESGKQALQAVDELWKGLTQIEVAKAEQARVLLQNEQQNIHTLAETCQTAEKEFSDLISSFTKWIMQYSESVTRAFKFR